MPMKDWFHLETNWDPWVPMTATDCQAEMASFTPEREKQCETYIKDLYHDLGKCTDLCQLYSDGRREAATAMMEATADRKARDAPSFRCILLLGDIVLLQSSPLQGSAEGLLAVLSTLPVLASDTRFTSIMSASTSHYTTLVRKVRKTPAFCFRLPRRNAKMTSNLHHFASSSFCIILLHRHLSHSSLQDAVPSTAEADAKRVAADQRTRVELRGLMTELTGISL